jgi:hypothetical protein
MAKYLLRMRDREGVRRALEANPAQLEFERDRSRQNIVLKARQMGITTWVAGRFFLKTITGQGVLTVQVAHTQEAAEGTFRIVQRFWECLPEEFRTGVLRRSIANVGAMRFPELDSEYRVVSAANPNAGRGLTMQNLHCSEVARWPGDARETLAGLRAALAPGGEMVLESTPQGAHGCFYEEWGAAVEPEARAEGRLVRHFFPWWKEPTYKAAAATDLTEEEEALMQRQNLTLEQIGYRRMLEASFHGLRAQEFAEDAETCFRATGDCCFDIEAIEQRLKAVGRPFQTRRGGALQVFLPAQAGKRYIVGVDTAGGGAEGDFAAAQVIERTSGLQCAELKERLNPSKLAQVAAELAREYGDALVAVERNNHGCGVLAYLESVEQYTHIYQQAGIAGWNTSAASKPVMVALMGALLAESPGLFLSRRLLAECRTFLTLPGGKTGAARGAHDDCVMAMAVAQSVRAEMLTGRKMP